MRGGNSSRAYTWYFRAMAHHALGNIQEASQWLRKADEWTDKELNDSEDPVAWNRELTLKMLREEAQALVDPERGGVPSDASTDKSASVTPAAKSE